MGVWAQIWRVIWFYHHRRKETSSRAIAACVSDRPPLVNCCHALFTGQPCRKRENTNEYVSLHRERERKREREPPPYVSGESFRRPSHFLWPCTQITSFRSASVTDSDIAFDIVAVFFSPYMRSMFWIEFGISDIFRYNSDIISYLKCIYERL